MLTAQKGVKKSFPQSGEAGISNIWMARAKYQAAFAKGQTLSGSGIGTLIRLSSASNSLACVKRPDWLFFRLSPLRFRPRVVVALAG